MNSPPRRGGGGAGVNSPLGRGVGGADGVVPRGVQRRSHGKFPSAEGCRRSRRGGLPSVCRNVTIPVLTPGSTPPCCRVPPGGLAAEHPYRTTVCGRGPHFSRQHQLTAATPRVSSTFGSKAPKQTGRRQHFWNTPLSVRSGGVGNTESKVPRQTVTPVATTNKVRQGTTGPSRRSHDGLGGRQTRPQPDNTAPNPAAQTLSFRTTGCP